MDYEGLAGARFNYVYEDGSVVDAVVSNCDPDIGYTLQDSKTGAYLACVNGPRSPLRSRRPVSDNELAMYVRDLQLTMGHIALHGVLSKSVIDAIDEECWGDSDRLGGAPSLESCPFGQ